MRILDVEPGRDFRVVFTVQTGNKNKRFCKSIGLIPDAFKSYTSKPSILLF